MRVSSESTLVARALRLAASCDPLAPWMASCFTWSMVFDISLKVESDAPMNDSAFWMLSRYLASAFNSDRYPIAALAALGSSLTWFTFLPLDNCSW